MTDTPRDALLAKNLPRIAVLAVALGATIVRLRFGWPAVVLWLAFCALSGALFLFWESVRAALDPDALGDDNDADLRALAQAELEDRKRAALRALKDIREEHSLEKLSDEDFRELEARYRAEARAVMQSLDELLGDHLARAEAEFDRIAAAAAVEPSPATATSAIATADKGREGPSQANIPDTKDLDAKATDAKATETKATDAKAPDAKAPDANAPAVAAPGVDALAPPTTASAARTCPVCGTANDADARFCKGCGGKLESAAS